MNELAVACLEVWKIGIYVGGGRELAAKHGSLACQEEEEEEDFQSPPCYYVGNIGGREKGEGRE